MKVKELQVGDGFMSNGVPYVIKVYFKGSSAIAEKLVSPYNKVHFEEEVEVEARASILALSCGDVFSYEGKVYTLESVDDSDEAVATHNESGNSITFNAYCQVIVQPR